MSETQAELVSKQRKIDNLLNKTVLDITVFSAAGWSVGIFAGLFFHRPAPIRHLLAGAGGSYGLVSNRISLKKYLWGLISIINALFRKHYTTNYIDRTINPTILG